MSLYAMQTAMGGRGWSAAALTAGIEAWAQQERLVISGETARSDLLQVMVVSVGPRCAWIVSLSRGEDTLDHLLRLGGQLCRDAQRGIRLVSTGAEDGSGMSTIVGYRDWRIDADGAPRLRSSGAASGWMRDHNPVPDDCPYEDFAMLFELLTDGEELDGEEGPTLALSAPALDDSPRISRVMRAALCARSVRTVPAPDGRVMVCIDRHEVRETVFVSPEEAERIAAVMAGST